MLRKTCVSLSLTHHYSDVKMLKLNYFFCVIAGRCSLHTTVPLNYTNALSDAKKQINILSH